VEGVELQLRRLRYQWQMSFYNLMEDIYNVILAKAMNYLQQEDMEDQLA